MKVRVSSCGALMWDAGQLVWDDYLQHRQFALAENTELVLRWFTDFRDIESVQNIGKGLYQASRWLTIAKTLSDHGILVVQGSQRHQQEQHIAQEWSRWGLLTRAYHFAARSHSATTFAAIAEDQERLEDKISAIPPPPAFMKCGDARRIVLPEPDPGVWQHRDLLDVLRRRRSRRDHGPDPIGAATLSALLKTAFGPLPIGSISPSTGVTVTSEGPLTDHWQRVFKTSPSGGARCPTEAYIYVRRAAGLEPGIYHYEAEGHALEHLDRRLTDTQLVEACGDQEWTASASLLIFYTAVISRSQWKYESTRAYRTLLLDVGHLSQTVYLLATAAGLHVTFTGALRDENVEKLLGIDASQQVVLGVSVLGSPPSGGADEFPFTDPELP